DDVSGVVDHADVFRIKVGRQTAGRTGCRGNGAVMHLEVRLYAVLSGQVLYHFKAAHRVGKDVGITQILVVLVGVDTDTGAAHLRCRDHALFDLFLLVGRLQIRSQR